MKPNLLFVVREELSSYRPYRLVINLYLAAWLSSMK